MSLPNQVTPLLQAPASTVYTINNSLRFRSSASGYLSRIPASAGSQTTWTFSGWFKRGALGTYQRIFNCYSGTILSLFRFNPSNQIEYWDFNTGTSTPVNNITTAQVFRDPSSWYHLICVYDTTNATSANRVRIYVNGVLASLSTATMPSLNYTGSINSTSIHYISDSGEPFDGYGAEINFVNAQALTPSSFGAYSTNGVWQPARYTGTYGTNGFYLKFASFGTAAALGTDSSGNGNTWTVNNFSVTAGTTYDPMLDSPTLVSPTVANYATLNPLQNGGGTASGGNLNMLGASGTWGSRVSTIAPTSGKWYFEITPTSGSATNGVQFGITKNATPTSYLGADSNGYSYYGFTGNKFNNGTSTAYGATVADNDVVGVAFDADAGSLTFYKNGTSQGVAFSGLTAGTWYLGVSCYNTATASINFGQRPFTYTPPSGFVRLNAYNLPTPTITNGATVMAATTYAGNNTAGRNILNSGNNPAAVSFKPDFVWIKNRTGANNNILTDSVRGATKTLISDSTSAETTVAGGMTAFNSNGFQVGYDGSAIVNASANNYVGWQWQAGQGSTSSNTAGTITSTVSVNATVGFSIVTYTGNGTNPGATIGHGLGVTPAMIITKSRSTSGEWPSYHQSIPINNTLYINATYASSTYLNRFSAVSSTTFTTGSSGGELNTNGTTYVAYCWSAVAGYSAFGSYTGNGSADGPFVYTGFRPRFVMVKRTDSTGDWQMYDTSQNTYNVSLNTLAANSANGNSSYVSGYDLDILSNGFKWRAAGVVNNASGGTYVYAAFAENPFRYALAR